MASTIIILIVPGRDWCPERVSRKDGGDESGFGIITIVTDWGDKFRYDGEDNIKMASSEAQYDVKPSVIRR